MNTRKLQSYFYPVLIKRYESDFNHYLEVSMQNGKLVVDSPNANYSHGNLHTVFKKAIMQLKLTENKNYSCLILGFGAGSIAHLLLEEFALQATITGVEIDPVMLEIYNDYFFIPNQNITLLNENAFDFLERNQQQFDCIFIDLFIDLEVPEAATDSYFFQRVKNAIHSQSMICMNIIGKQQVQIFNRWKHVFNRNDFKKDYLDLNTIFFSLPK